MRAPEHGPGPVRNLTPPPANAGPGVGAGGGYQGDHNSPILQQWAAAIVKERADADRAGRPFPSAQVMCVPHGIPYVLELNDAVQFLHTRELFVILYAREMRARLVYMNAAHPRDLKPSAYGHSVAHWEGDTLVVDSIGFTADTWTDRLGTPHSAQLRVVERYRRIAPDRVRVDITVEDPGAFTMPWSAYVIYGPEDSYHEQVCAENNIDTLTAKPRDIPSDTTPDF
jgi:hypothetical protein